MAIPIERRRQTLGARFSEGARLLWLALAKDGIEHAAAAKRLGIDRAVFSRLIYGDAVPPIAVLARVDEEFRIAPASWAKPPTTPFAPWGAEVSP